MEALEEEYTRKVEEETTRCQLSLEERLAAVQSELKIQYKQQLENEMTLYQERELAKMRREEREKYQNELESGKEKLQCSYHLRLENVKKSEQGLVERYRKKEMVSKSFGVMQHYIKIYTDKFDLL